MPSGPKLCCCHRRNEPSSQKTISYHDYKEDFYHAFLAAIFAGAGYTVESNREHGEGRSDVVYDSENGRVAVFEIKYAQTSASLPTACEAALTQIATRMYAQELRTITTRFTAMGSHS